MNEKGITRRNFLRLSATKGAGALIVPEVVAKVSSSTDTKKKTRYYRR